MRRRRFSQNGGVPIHHKNDAASSIQAGARLSGTGNTRERWSPSHAQVISRDCRNEKNTIENRSISLLPIIKVKPFLIANNFDNDDSNEGCVMVLVFC